MKKNRQRLLLLILTIIITIGVCGCDMNNNSTARNESGNNTSNVSENVELNNRQLQILEAQGLPQNFRELSSSQKKAIVSIEELLSSAESKYGMDFCYAGYVEASTLESEKVIAYPAGGTESTDSFLILRSSDGTITDEYMNVALRGEYSELILMLAKDALSSENTKVFVEVTNTALTSIPDDIDQLVGNVEGTSVIFVDGSDVSEEQFEFFVSSIKQALEEKQLYGTAQIILLNADTIKYLTQYNYTDYLDPECYTDRESISIKK